MYPIAARPKFRKPNTTSSPPAPNLTRDYFAGDVAPGLYPEQLYGRDLALLAPQTPETFEMQ